MSLNKLIKDQSGFTYTLEAILGIFLILGTVVYVTTNMPYSAQKTGEHSKVQLVNIGRDTMDLIVITPVYETCPDCLVGIVNRQYTLVADKTFVMPGETVNFTVYYLDGRIVDKPLTLEQTVLGRDTSFRVNMTTINGTLSWSFSAGNESEFNIRAVDPFNNPTTWSNYVTISIGYYYLITDTNGIFVNGDKNVSGVVYNSSGFGIPNLNITILDYTYMPIGPNPVNQTRTGTLIESFDNPDNWSTNGNKSSDPNNIDGNPSLSINRLDSFWIQKDISQRFEKYDILSFYFYANTGSELVTVNLLNGTLPVLTQTFAPTRNWSKINTLLNISNPSDINRIRIDVTNTTPDNYLFDNMTLGDGKFSFVWPNLGNGDRTGTYYIQASDGIHSSNRHRIIYADKNNGDTLCCDAVIFETMSVDLFMVDKDGNLVSITETNNFFINNQRYNTYNTSTMSITTSPDKTRATLTVNTSGDYYIYYGNVGQQDNANGAKTNSILIRVLPLINAGPTGDTCVDKNELNSYMGRFMPPYVNYNLYLIDPSGNRFTRCPKFEDGEVINGYPTINAVTVNQPLHIKYRDIDNILELRMVLWYK